MALCTSSTLLFPAKFPTSNGDKPRWFCADFHRRSASDPLSSIPFAPATICSTSDRSPATPPTTKHVYPDPIPEFAAAETENFRGDLTKILSDEAEAFGDELKIVVNVCTEIFSEFLHKEYGGPGTLLVEPFTDMLVALKEKKLRGAVSAARAAILWAQSNVDEDWKLWTSKRQN